MLRPKNPLIDEPLIAASAGTFRRVKTTYWVLLGIISVILLTWLWLLKSFGEKYIPRPGGGLVSLGWLIGSFKRMLD